MYKSILTILISLGSIICYAQTTQIKYYNNEWLQKEVSAEKAKFLKTVTNNADGTITTEIKNIKKNEVIRSETYKGEEPYGIWIYETGKGTSSLDFNFPLNYTGEKCNDSIGVAIKDYFKDDDSLGYKAPKIWGAETSFFQYIAHTIVFPDRAKEENIQGRVYVSLTITKEGVIENVYVKKGTNILLDKEAVRVFEAVKIIEPANA